MEETRRHQEKFIIYEMVPRQQENKSCLCCRFAYFNRHVLYFDS